MIYLSPEDDTERGYDCQIPKWVKVSPLQILRSSNDAPPEIIMQLNKAGESQEMIIKYFIRAPTPTMISELLHREYRDGATNFCHFRIPPRRSFDRSLAALHLHWLHCPHASVTIK